MRRPANRQSVLALVVVLGAAGFAPWLGAQAPPPQPLPTTITGQPLTAPNVQPASGTVGVPTAPIQRFQDFRTLPPETVQAIYGMRASADWLWRMNQPNGRFLSGLNPALKQALPDDPDFRQAVATLALCRAARFTGDEKFAPRAAQAVLTLLSLTRPDPANPGVREPIAPSERCNRVGFAAVLALAIAEIPNPDAKLIADAEALTLFVRNHCAADGSVQAFDSPTDPAKSDPNATTLYPGLALQSLVVSVRRKPDPATQAAIARGITFYRTAYKSQPNPMLAATMLPAITDYYLLTKDANTAAAGLELADGLCACQYTRADATQIAWIGGFRPSAGTLNVEPRYETAAFVEGLAAATTLTRHAPDLTRFEKYRAACVGGLLFAKSLQFTEDNTEHFEKAYRSRFIVGGVHLSPTEASVRADVTGLMVLACVRYLESGAEVRAE